MRKSLILTNLGGYPMLRLSQFPLQEKAELLAFDFRHLVSTSDSDGGFDALAQGNFRLIIDDWEGDLFLPVTVKMLRQRLKFETE